MWPVRPIHGLWVTASAPGAQAAGPVDVEADVELDVGVVGVVDGEDGDDGGGATLCVLVVVVAVVPGALEPVAADEDGDESGVDGCVGLVVLVLLDVPAPFGVAVVPGGS